MSILELGAFGNFLAAGATIGTLLYLATQVRQNVEIAKAQFGHGLTQRLYDRYFLTAKDKEYAEFIGKDWSSEELEAVDRVRISTFTVMLFVDLFDVYDKVKQGLVDKKHLDIRVHMLQTGIFKSDHGKRSWLFWKSTRDQEFVEWFEREILYASSKGFENLSKEDSDLKKGPVLNFHRE